MAQAINAARGSMAATLLCGLAALSPIRSDAAEAVATYNLPMQTHASQGPVHEIGGSEARLTTTAKAAFVTVRTAGLEPNHVYTLWWIVIDDPAACETSPCTPKDVLSRTAEVDADVIYAAGVIAGPDGTAAFNDALAKGPMPGSWYGNGFDNPQGAEQHFVVNAHGPLLPAIGASMLASYRGGCRDDSLPAAFPDTAKADGIPGPSACAPLQDVIFQQ